MNRLNEIFGAMPLTLKTKFEKIPQPERDKMLEIRLRTGKPVSLTYPQGVRFLLNDGRVSPLPTEESVTVSKWELSECFKLACGCSVYSHQEEIKNGFITMKNGHRIGLAGTAVQEKGKISGIRDVSSLNIRIAREVEGASLPIIYRLWSTGRPRGALIAGAPLSGKTTILRDLARQFSKGILGPPLRVCVVDERGEIAAVASGVSGNELGPSCDILDNYPKSEGILMALRCLSPDVIICDELGGGEEVQAVIAGLNAGVPIISSLHASSVKELRMRPQSRALLETGAFTDIILLKGLESPGTAAGYYKAGEI
ncbi:MAG: Flp pilus assembly complex ATPase component TadA [Oscillospiraceae bacterium]|jgi:stage III sporulation protein AA|nr:Flp pilus assembly complex ATPase component TadA [Oscillospiraceae bacterium]